jgi:predicted transcriptional regulator
MQRVGKDRRAAREVIVEDKNLIELVADIVSAHVSNNTVAVGDLPTLIQKVHTAMSSLGAPALALEEPRQPAVSIQTSVKPDYIACLACGLKQKTLKRHLRTAHGLTPDLYRKEFGLPASYPMVARNYAEKRRALAHKFGLGRGGRSGPESTAPAP